MRSWSAVSQSAFANALWLTALQERIPSESVSRVSAYDWLGSLVFKPAGYAFVGLLVAAQRIVHGHAVAERFDPQQPGLRPFLGRGRAPRVAPPLFLVTLGSQPVTGADPVPLTGVTVAHAESLAAAHPQVVALAVSVAVDDPAP